MSPINAEISNFFWYNKAKSLMTFISSLWNLSNWSGYRIIKVNLWISPISIHKKTTSLMLSSFWFCCSVSQFILPLFVNSSLFSFNIFNSNYSVSPTSCNLPCSFVHIHTLLFDHIILFHFPAHLKNMFSSLFWCLHVDFLFVNMTETVKQVLLFHK